MRFDSNARQGPETCSSRRRIRRQPALSVVAPRQGISGCSLVSLSQSPVARRTRNPRWRRYRLPLVLRHHVVAPDPASSPGQFSGPADQLCPRDLPGSFRYFRRRVSPGSLGSRFPLERGPRRANLLRDHWLAFRECAPRRRRLLSREKRQDRDSRGRRHFLWRAPSSRRQFRRQSNRTIITFPPTGLPISPPSPTTMFSSQIKPAHRARCQPAQHHAAQRHLEQPDRARTPQNLHCAGASTARRVPLRESVHIPTVRLRGTTNTSSLPRTGSPALLAAQAR